MLYVCDFETTTTANDCRVWGWGRNNLETDYFDYGHTLDEFMHEMFALGQDSTVYFHNVKFDGSFILPWCFKNGYTHTFERRLINKEFSTLIDQMGAWYFIKIKNKGITITIYDSLKIIPLSVEKIAKSFDLPICKGEIDYHKDRHIGYKMDDEELSYLKNDVKIVSYALKYFHNLNLKKMTQASNSMFDYKQIITTKVFNQWFPKLECDTFIRQSYKGGWTYLNPKYKRKVVNGGRVYDVNSLYPSVMYNCDLPYGEPIYYEGEYQHDNYYPLYVQSFICNFELKENHLPTLQIKGSLSFKDTEYLTSSDGNDVLLTMTSVDFELFKNHYNLYNVEYIEGYKFKKSTELFKKYIDKWIAIKEQATIDGNEGLRTLAKLMLNALYGKFGLNPCGAKKIPTWVDGMVKYEVGDLDEREPIYVAVASFITSYARRTTIEGAQANYNRFIYADTDSLHLEDFEEPLGIEVDNVKLGAWKHEGDFSKGKYLRQKSYAEIIDGKTHITCAGLPKDARENITFDEFDVGLKLYNKKQFKTVKNGCILVDTEFEIKI